MPWQNRFTPEARQCQSVQFQYTILKLNLKFEIDFEFAIEIERAKLLK